MPPLIAMKIIAIDPGASGSVCYYDGNSVRAHNMPETVGDLIEFFRTIDKDTVVVMEEVSGFIGKPHPGSRMFNFGLGYGQLQGVIQTLGFRLELVRPLKWQKALGLHRRKGMTPSEWKRKLRAEAQRLYPDIKVTLKTADALLILEYQRRKK